MSSLTGTRKVTAPDGTAWKVRPRWRVGPDVKLPRRKKKDRGDGDAWFDLPDMGDADDLIGAIFFVVVLGVFIVLAILFVWPLLALAVELLVAVILIAAGVVARIAFGKPFRVEASSSRGERLFWSVRGYGTMRRVCADIAQQLAAGNTRPQVADAEPLQAMLTQ